MASRYPRGSEWRIWDLHIHTPASFHWDGPPCDFSTWGNDQRNTIDQMIAALNEADPAVYAVMDYWSFDGWFALQRRLGEVGAVKLKKTVFPGIELRLAAPMKGRLNAHVIFSDQIPEQRLKDFLGILRLEVGGRPLSKSALVDLARSVGADLLKDKGFKKLDVDIDDSVALLAGSVVAEINCDSYKQAIAAMPSEMAVGFMPFDTSDGLAEVKWRDHYGYFIGLFSSSPIFESRSAELRSCFLNEETPTNKSFLKDFQFALGNTPRLVVSGSDAHRFKGATAKDVRGYGDFPSGKKTWIKADPTFPGLLQAIREPSKRSFIGDKPEKLAFVEANRTFFIDRVEVSKIPPGSNGIWLDGTSIPVNPDLTAVIGNKGSGKSALTDVIALAGYSQQKQHFSFLRRERFRGKSGEPAKHFEGTLAWLAGPPSTQNLNSDPPPEKVELVKYIPQGHFESLCNDHVAGRNDAFEAELRAVIFSHLSDVERLGALDFGQLIERQESAVRDQLDDLRRNLARVNRDISAAEDQLQPTVRSTLQELLALREELLNEHDKSKPQPVPKPTEALTQEQAIAMTELEQVEAAITALSAAKASRSSQLSEISAKRLAIANVRERIRLFEKSHRSLVVECAKDLETLGLQPDGLVQVAVDVGPLTSASTELDLRESVLEAQRQSDERTLQSHVERKKVLASKLNEPQQRHQDYLKRIGEWEARRAEIIGTADAPDTYLGVKQRLAQLDGLPNVLTDRRQERRELVLEIFNVLNKQREARARLFKPVQDLIERNALIREDYRLQFQANLSATPELVSSQLFALVKQTSGEFRGEDDSLNAVRKLCDQYDFRSAESVVDFVDALLKRLASATGGSNAIGIRSALRKDRTAVEVYDQMYGLGFIEPKYTLLFQGAQIEQLSPGQRGALLLIFYLLVDKGRHPILLDQPEENLDNETVVGLLVPVVTEAKKRRQIIMVTHNPNLAVVCDAEQIVHASFDRTDDSRITYTTGAIEDPEINSLVVDVLEGTWPAFTNRESKYQKKS